MTTKPARYLLMFLLLIPHVWAQSCLVYDMPTTAPTYTNTWTPGTRVWAVGDEMNIHVDPWDCAGNLVGDLSFMDSGVVLGQIIPFNVKHELGGTGWAHFELYQIAWDHGFIGWSVRNGWETGDDYLVAVQPTPTPTPVPIGIEVLGTAMEVYVVTEDANGSKTRQLIYK